MDAFPLCMAGKKRERKILHFPLITILTMGVQTYYMLDAFHEFYHQFFVCVWVLRQWTDENILKYVVGGSVETTIWWLDDDKLKFEFLGGFCVGLCDVIVFKDQHSIFWVVCFSVMMSLLTSQIKNHDSLVTIY
jgi:hypothetical protein